MSYSIRLTDPVTGETLQLDSPHEMRGGTYQHGGTTECWINITYNYGPIYRRIFKPVCSNHPEKDSDGLLTGIRSIYGMTGAESIPVLQRAADQLGDDTNPDYWEATDGNAKRALYQLIALARLRPDGVWDGD